MSRLKNSITPSTSPRAQDRQREARRAVRRGRRPRHAENWIAWTTSGIHAGGRSPRPVRADPTPRANVGARLTVGEFGRTAATGACHVPTQRSARAAAIHFPERAVLPAERARRRPRACAAPPRRASPTQPSARAISCTIAGTAPCCSVLRVLSSLEVPSRHAYSRTDGVQTTYVSVSSAVTAASNVGGSAMTTDDRRGRRILVVDDDRALAPRHHRAAPGRRIPRRTRPATDRRRWTSCASSRST